MQEANIHGCKADNIHGCKGVQVFHSLKMNNFYEPVQQNDFKGQLTNPGRLTYMDVKELTYMDRRRPGVPLLTNNRSNVKFQEPVQKKMKLSEPQNGPILRVSNKCYPCVLFECVGNPRTCAGKWS